MGANYSNTPPRLRARRLPSFLPSMSPCILSLSKGESREPESKRIPRARARLSSVHGSHPFVASVRFVVSLSVHGEPVEP